MTEAINFYTAYQYDYYIYKLLTLKQILSNTDKFEKEFLSGVINGYDKNDFQRVLKSEIRQSYYHAIETTFELIFALTPKNGILADKDILMNLSTSTWRKNYDKITEIATQESGLNFLDEEIRVNENGKPVDKPITIGRYLFYYGILHDNKQIPSEYLALIEPSISAIKQGLKIISNDFINREEYNSYKHAIRIIPALKSFYVINAETQKTIANWDLTDSMTFLTKDKETEEIKFTTKLFDTERDIRLTLFCTNLISNLIQLRKAGFKHLKKDEKVPVLFFGEKEVAELDKRNVTVQDLIYKITPIKNAP